MMFSLLLALAASATAQARACPLVYPVAADERAARRIAEAVIAARPFQPRQNYVLRVIADRDDPGRWVAFQTLPAPRRPGPRGTVRGSLGGGSLEMRIDRCTGAISQLHYSR